MKRALCAAVAVLSLSLAGCSLFGVSPEDSASARDDASRVVKTLRLVGGFIGIAVTEANAFCSDAANAQTWPCTTDYPDAAKKVSDLIGEHLAKLDAALSAPTTDEELFIALTAQGWDAYGDAMDVINELRGISPAAARAVAELPDGNPGFAQIIVEKYPVW